MLHCQLSSVTERHNRWHLEGTLADADNGAVMPFSISVRLGWLTWEGVSGPMFQRTLDHFTGLLGTPEAPPSCSGSSECQDDAVYLSTNWPIQQEKSIEALLESLLMLAPGSLREAGTGEQGSEARG